jgi:hypothetical protein
MKRKYLISFLSSRVNPSREGHSIAHSIEDLEKELDFLSKDDCVYSLKITVFYE